MGTADSEIGRKSPATYPAPSAQAGWRGNGVCGPGRDAIAWTGMGASSFIEAGYCIACAFGTIGLLFYAEGSLASAIHEARRNLDDGANAVALRLGLDCRTVGRPEDVTAHNCVFDTGTM